MAEATKTRTPPPRSSAPHRSSASSRNSAPSKPAPKQQPQQQASNARTAERTGTSTTSARPSQTTAPSTGAAADRAAGLRSESPTTTAQGPDTRDKVDVQLDINKKNEHADRLASNFADAFAEPTPASAPKAAETKQADPTKQADSKRPDVQQPDKPDPYAGLKSESYFERSKTLDTIREQIKQGNLAGLEALRGMEGFDRERQQLLEQVSGQFSASKDPAERARLASYALEAFNSDTGYRSAEDAATARQAVAALRERALAGDPRALQELSRTAQLGGFKALSQDVGNLLYDSAQSGHAGQVVDSLTAAQRQSAEAARKDRYGFNTPNEGLAWSVLGRSAALLPPGDPRVAEVRAGLRAELDRTRPQGQYGIPNSNQIRDNVLQGMGALGSQLGMEDARSLAFWADTDGKSAGVLNSALKNVTPEQRKEILDPLFADLRKGLSYGPTLGAESLAALKDYATPKEVDALRESIRHSRSLDESRVGERALGSLLESPNGDVRSSAANALLDRDMSRTLDEATSVRLADYALASDDPKLKAQVAQRLEYDRFSDADLKSYTNNYQRYLADSLKWAMEHDPKSDMAKLGRLMAAKQLGEDKDNKYSKNVNLAAVNAELRRLTEGPLADDFQRLHERAKKDAWVDGSSGGYENYLTSDTFMKRMELTPPDQRQALMEKEMAKLNIMNPSAVAPTMQRILEKDIEANAFQRLSEMNPDEARAALNGMAKHFGLGELTPEQATMFHSMLKDHMKDFKKGAKGMPGLLDTIGKFANRADLLNDADNVAKNKTAAGLLKWMKAAEPHMSRIAAGATLYGMYADGVDLHDPKKAAKFANDLFSLAGYTDDIAKGVDGAAKLGSKLPGLSKLMTNMPQLAGKMATFSKVLGPVGTAIGSGLDFYNAWESASYGDMGGAVGNTVSGFGGALMVAGAIPSPLTPIFLGAGAVLTLAGLGMSYFWGDSGEQRELRKLGVYQD